MSVGPCSARVSVSLLLMLHPRQRPVSSRLTGSRSSRTLSPNRPRPHSAKGGPRQRHTHTHRGNTTHTDHGSIEPWKSQHPYGLRSEGPPANLTATGLGATPACPLANGLRTCYMAAANDFPSASGDVVYGGMSFRRRRGGAADAAGGMDVVPWNWRSSGRSARQPSAAAHDQLIIGLSDHCRMFSLYRLTPAVKPLRALTAGASPVIAPPERQ